MLYLTNQIMWLLVLLVLLQVPLLEELVLLQPWLVLLELLP